MKCMSLVVSMCTLFLLARCSSAGDSVPSTATASEPQPTVESCQLYREIFEFAMKESDGGVRGAELTCSFPQSRANCSKYVALIRERISLTEQIFDMFRRDCKRFEGNGPIKAILEKLSEYQRQLDEAKAKLNSLRHHGGVFDQRRVYERRT